MRTQKTLSLDRNKVDLPIGNAEEGQGNVADGRELSALADIFVRSLSKREYLSEDNRYCPKYILRQINDKHYTTMDEQEFYELRNRAWDNLSKASQLIYEAQGLLQDMYEGTDGKVANLGYLLYDDVDGNYDLEKANDIVGGIVDILRFECDYVAPDAEEEDDEIEDSVRRPLTSRVRDGRSRPVMRRR